MTGDGSVIVSVAAGAFSDAAGNNSALSTSTDNIVTYDTTGPTVTVNQAVGQADPTNGSTIQFAVVFSESTIEFDVNDVILSGTALPTTAVVTPVSGTTYDVFVSGMSVDGTVIVTIPDGAVTDALGNNSPVSTSTDNVVTYDTSGPTVTVNQATGQADPTNASTINYTAVFSEVTTTFDSSDVIISGTAAGSLSSVVTGSGTTYNVAVSGMTGVGDVVVDVAVGVATDLAGNPNSASTSTDNVVYFDNTPPAFRSSGYG